MNRTAKPTEPWSRDRLLSWGLCDATGRVLPACGQMPRMTRSTTQHTEATDHVSGVRLSPQRRQPCTLLSERAIYTCLSSVHLRTSWFHFCCCDKTTL